MLFNYELLNEVQLNHVANFYDISEFEDGEKTGSDHKELKHNMQMLPEQADACWNIIQQAFELTDECRYFMQLTRNTVGLFCRYTEGMHYDWHVDSAEMDIRNDVSTTLFLNDPSEYEGGELVLRYGTEHLYFKLPAGHAISYPTGTPHKVMPVTKGERRVSVFWSESMFRKQADRNFMFNHYQMMCSTCKAFGCVPDDIDPNHPLWETFQHYDAIRHDFIRSYADK